MAVITNTFKRTRLAAVLLAASLMPLPLLAQNTETVPDVLDMPALDIRNAQGSLQLGVSRAGDRLVSVGERGIILLSDDNGSSWRQAAHVPVSVTLTDVSFVSAEQGWAIGHSGVLLYSADAGETWEKRMDGSQAAQIILEGARQRLAEGVEGAARAVRDAEFLVEDGPDKPFLEVTFADARRGYLTGAYGMALQTLDGGQSWESIGDRLPNPDGNHLYGVLLQGDRVLIIGEQGAIFLSEDRGQSFTSYETPYAGTFFGGEWLNGGYMVYGLQGNAWRTADNGESWQRIAIDQPVTLTTSMRASDGSLLLADESGQLLRSSNNGITFTELPYGTGAGATGLLEAADGTLIVTSMRGVRRLENNKQETGGTQ